MVTRFYNLDTLNDEMPVVTTKTETPYKHLPPVFLWSFFLPRYWFTWLGLGLLFLIAQLPLTINLGLGKALGWVLYKIVPGRRHIAETNLRLCFPELSEAERNAMAYKVVLSCGISIFESAMSLWGPAYRLRKYFTLSGLENIEAAQAQGRGVILLGCHMTTMDICGRMLAFHAKFDIQYRQDPNKLMAYMLVKARERFNGECIISVETRKMVRHLQQGKIVWYAPDQDYGIQHSVFSPFFGIPAATVIGTARFARMGNAVVIPFYHHRDATGHYHIELGAPIENFPANNVQADCACINRVIEQMILRQPDQYLWVHRRFKTRPQGEPDFYPKRKASSN